MALVRRVFAGGLIAAACVLPAIATSPDSAFAQKAMVAGMEELDLASMALGKTTNADVLSFATRMQTDHHKANQQLQGIAKSEGIQLPQSVKSDVIAPQYISDEQKLKSLTGKQFDNGYIRQQIAAHKQAIALFQKEAQSGKDPRLVAFAKKSLPMLKQHLALAQQVQKKLPSGI
jgi:putative membrane protein